MQTSPIKFFTRTIIHYGTGTRSLLPNLLLELGGKKAIIITERDVSQSTILNEIKELFEGFAQEVEIVGVFDEIEQETHAETINQCTRFFKELNADSIIALGCSVALDTAKAVKWMLHKDIQDINQVRRLKEQWPQAQPILIPHIAVPTFAGTGAEITDVTVFSNNEANSLKSSISHPFINADIAILDPELTLYLSPQKIASAGFTTLVNAMEAYFSPMANPMTDAYALQAIRLVANNLSIAVHDLTSLKARANLQLASLMAKISFMPVINAMPIHNMALTYSAMFGIPQMLANVVLLPNLVEALPTFYLPRIQEFAQSLGIADRSMHDMECLHQVVRYIENLRKEIGLPESLVEYGLKVESMQDIISAVHKEPVGAYFVIPAEIVARITHRAFDFQGYTNSKNNVKK